MWGSKGQKGYCQATRKEDVLSACMNLHPVGFLFAKPEINGKISQVPER
jgi:hypothetical protein